MRIIRFIGSNIRTAYFALRTTLLRLCGASDTARWGSEANLKSDWDSRTIRIAEFIPSNSRVLEFGAGRKILQQHLKAGCVYTPSDIVSRGDGTLVCDLNAGTLPEFPFSDVVVFSGVLEYVSNVGRLIDALSSKTGMIIASYAVCVATEATSKNVIMQRRSLGWVNEFTYDEFIELFEKRGFHLSSSSEWHTQKLFIFVRAD